MNDEQGKVGLSGAGVNLSTPGSKEGARDGRRERRAGADEPRAAGHGRREQQEAAAVIDDGVECPTDQENRRYRSERHSEAQGRRLCSKRIRICSRHREQLSSMPSWTVTAIQLRKLATHMPR